MSTSDTSAAKRRAPIDMDADEFRAAAHDLVSGAYRFGAAISAPRSSLVLEVLR